MERERKIRAEQEARRQKFLQQRSVELDRTACQDAYQDRACQSATRSEQSSVPSCSLRPEEILDQVADRMTNRLRVEIREQLQKEVEQSIAANCDLQAKMEAVLSTEIEKHCCPVCYELMAPPLRAPILLFPCGHTFCDNCFKRQSKVKNTCPYCRATVQSHAPNIALQQLIDNFVQQREQAASGKLLGWSSSQGSGGEDEPVRQVHPSELDDATNARRYREELQRVEMRVRVLTNERSDVLAEHQKAEQKCHSIAIVEEHLGAEAARVEAEIERLRAELLLINEHLRLKRSERETHQSQATTLMTQAEMLRSALEPLEAARAKARLLLLNFEARK